MREDWWWCCLPPKCSPVACRRSSSRLRSSCRDRSAETTLRSAVVLSFCRSATVCRDRFSSQQGCRLASGLLASPPRFGIRYASPLCFSKFHTFQTLLSKFRGAKTLLPPRSKLHRTRGWLTRVLRLTSRLPRWAMQHFCVQSTFTPDLNRRDTSHVYSVSFMLLVSGITHDTNPPITVSWSSPLGKHLHIIVNTLKSGNA